MRHWQPLFFHEDVQRLGELKEFLSETRRSREAKPVIIPCIDLQGGLAVQLVPRAQAKARDPRCVRAA